METEPNPFTAPLSLISAVFRSRASAVGSAYDPSWVDSVPAAFLAALGGDEVALQRAPSPRTG